MQVLPMFFLKLANWVVANLLANSCYKAAKQLGNFSSLLIKNPSLRPHTSIFYPSVSKFPSEGSRNKTVVCDIHATLLRTTSIFPYFMLVAFEGGSIIRAFFLLLSYPLVMLLDPERGFKLMVFVSFSGLSVKGMETVARAVLPKVYMENLHFQAYEIFSKAEKKVVFTSAPKVMVEFFLKDCLNADDVKGSELEEWNGFFTGFLAPSGILVKHKALKEHFGDFKPDIGLGGAGGVLDHLFISQCKEAYVVTRDDRKMTSNSVMPKEKYPKPLIFHDGRLAFFPTPLATLFMFLWLPIALPLSVIRLLIGLFLPYKIAFIVGSFIGLRLKVSGLSHTPKHGSKKGVLYVCNHRTLLDPIFLCTSLCKPLTAVTYSLSKLSEFLAPMKTMSLARDRKKDAETMQRLLSEGDLVVCPEGTTCREPYLLRFSSLFAELADEIVPVAINTKVTMFHGTTASGLKCLDPLFFLLNPCPSYSIEFLPKVPREETCGGGLASVQVANIIQRRIADALGFECTNLTRRDKYLMLAGNEGFVQPSKKNH